MKGNNSKKRSLLGKNDSLKLNSSKRALFQSPDDNKYRNIPRHNKNLKYSPKNVRVQQSKRALWPNSSKKETESEVNVNGKTERVVCKTNPNNKCNRNLVVNEVRTLSSSYKKSPKETCCSGCKQVAEKPNYSGLSGSHRQKLLWAISNALREEGIRMIHEKFRPCASVLFKVCQKLWLERKPKLTNGGSTSENMLSLARKFSSEVVDCIEKDSSNTNLAELCSGLLKTAFAKELMKESVSSDKNRTSKMISKENILFNNIRKYDSVTQCELDSEKSVGSNSTLNRIESLKYTSAEMQNATINSQESGCKLYIKDGSKQHFVCIEDEETKFSILKSNCNITDYENGLPSVDILKPNISLIKKISAVKSSTNSSVNCDDASNVTKAFSLKTEAVPSCSINSKVNCLNNKSNIESVTIHSMPHTVSDTASVLNFKDRIDSFSNLIKDNVESIHSVVNNIPVSEMLSWNADPISRLKSNTTLDVFAKDSSSRKVNVDVMSHWQNLVTIKETKQKTSSKSPCENYSGTKLDTFCSLESTVDTDCSSSVHSNTITSFDFSSIIDESKSWFQGDQHETCDAIHFVTL